MQPFRGFTLAAVFLVLFQILPRAQAQHSHGAMSTSSDVDMDMVGHHSMPMNEDANTPPPPSYFHHTEHAVIMYAHIGLMILAWTLVLPTAVMLSVGRSRTSLLVQFLFHLLNGLGIFSSIVYNAQTPDLYENNAHHKAGWAISSLVAVWTLMGIVTLYTRRKPDSAVQPVSQRAMAEHHKIHYGHSHDAHRQQRWSHDSGHGTEQNTDSVCTGSRTNSWQAESGNPTKPYHDLDDADDDDAEHQSFLDPEKRIFTQGSRLDRFLTRTVFQLGSSRLATILSISYIILERFMPLLAFLALTTGIVTYSGIFRARAIFGGLAHFIKGGIFFWYGLLTFGRWMGCFADFGWAWNLKPGAEIVGRATSRIPSAEFTESFVIFLYGASNVFLEHLSGWGGEWTARDLEHISITIMFFGGGLLGMLVESRRIQKLLNRNITQGSDYARTSSPLWQTPSSYVHSSNPMPATVILLLGLMMSSHHQHSAIAGAIHKQWGTMFVGFALARGVTYVTLWIKPVESYLPSRPPSEIVASFCLVSGGIIFMASNSDTVDALENYSLDAMFVFTVVMGFTALIMAWALTMVVVKGWAVRRQMTYAPGRIPMSPA